VTLGSEPGRVPAVAGLFRFEHLTTNEDRMPTGPKGQKRPADVIGNAVRVM
jgi:hypothetical protein